MLGPSVMSHPSIICGPQRPSIILCRTPARCRTLALRITCRSPSLCWAPAQHHLWPSSAHRLRRAVRADHAAACHFRRPAVIAPSP